MEHGGLLEHARASAGLTQDELARRAGTWRTALSVYEIAGSRPRWTFARLLSEAGYELAAQPQVMLPAAAARGRLAWVPDHLPPLDMARASRGCRCRCT